MSVVSNTTVLSNFAAIGQLDKLRVLFSQLFVPLEVVHEIEAGLEDGYLFCGEILDRLGGGSDWLRAATLLETEIASLRELPATLHAGEASGLVMAQARDWLFLTDDRAARREAVRRQVRVSGSLGCLVAGARGGSWSVAAADEDLRRMRAAGYYSPAASIAEWLRS